MEGEDFAESGVIFFGLLSYNFSHSYSQLSSIPGSLATPTSWAKSHLINKTKDVITEALRTYDGILSLLLSEGSSHTHTYTHETACQDFRLYRICIKTYFL